MIDPIIASVPVLPYRFRDDWFVVTPDQARELAHVPGLQCDERRQLWIIPRNVLPLLNQSGSQRPSALPSFGDGTTELRAHQRAGVEFIRARRGTLLADGMRVGKTGAIVGAHDPLSGPLVVIGPLATKHVWLSWFRRRWPDEEPLVLAGRSYSDRVRDSKLVFGHYDVLPAWQSLGLGNKIGTLVFDEGHALSNRKSKRSQAAMMIAPAAEQIVVATGTPLWNKPAGLYSMLLVCNPGGWGTWSDFTIAYADGRPGSHGWITGSATNAEELRARLREVMLRRTWRELEDDLAPTQRDIERVEVSEGDGRELDLLMMQLSDINQNRRTLVGQMARYRRVVGKYKAPRAAQLAEQSLPAVVWTWHKSVAKDVASRLSVPHWIVNGDVAEEKREAILDEWRATQDGVLIMSLAVGQAGIDLSHSKRCIFAELDWTPAVIGQAEMRTFDPTRADHVTYVVAHHDIDEKLAKCLAEKCEQALLLGTPAADTAIDMLKRVLSGEEDDGDLDALVARVREKVRTEGTTLL